ncbi:MAG: PAC2 family protein [Nitrososphaerota archaeon]|nr:PAC2 family protein [Candidatus Bathyarchaeota archaeon]MCX8162192.1 PAC2 family protein [Candidatus Bathyarchaeota archaeon]MDW8062242.1 PAC2 family protein [Nitrososphaerota archaeon]
MRKPVVIWVKRNLEFNNPLVIEGFPGLGYIGRITVDYIVEKLQAIEFARLYTPYFPQHVLVDSYGEARLLGASFYHWSKPNDGRSIILVSGDSQAQTVEGQYKLASTILGFTRRLGARRILCIGGYEAYVDGRPKLYVAGTDPEVVGEAISMGVEVGRIGSPIVGLAGVILGIAKFYDMKGIAVLVETPGYYPDVVAAREAVLFVSRYTGIDIDVSDLEVYAAKLSQTLRGFEETLEELRQLSESARITDRGRLTYIS